MTIPEAKRAWSGQINTVTIGAGPEEGGTRSSVVTVGGATALPFYHFEGVLPHPPVVAMEVWDVQPEGWPDVVKAPFSSVMDDPAAWARVCVDEHGAQLIALRLQGCDPGGADKGPQEAVKAVRAVLEAVGVPLIVWGCGTVDKDNDVFPAVAEVLAGENCLLGTITEDNYKTLTALGTAYGHKIVAESPVDINIAKQVNILALDAGYPMENLVMYPSTGALGYGIEYVYSIMERSRIAALQGDKAMAMPILCDLGTQVWKAKEARASEEELPGWGAVEARGPMWEAATAYTYLLAGADMLIMRHPDAVGATQRAIARLMANGGGS